MQQIGLVLAGLLTAGVGSLGGLGGAVLLVPLLVLFGMPASEAAPLGLMTVAAGSLAASQRQLGEKLVNHRLGVVTEIAGSSGAIAGALLSGAIADRWLTRILAVAALLGAVIGGKRKGIRNPARDGYTEADIGEWPGSLAGAYPLNGGIAPYQTRRLPVGLATMAGAGVVAGIAGVSGGFIKTPTKNEIMWVPVKVAAATTSFTIGITSATALIVFAFQGRIDVKNGAAVIVGSLLGGQIGSRYQARLSPIVARKALAVLLLIVAVVLLVRS